MENKRILVIGGTGYIGRSLVSVLFQSGYDLSLLSRGKIKRNIDDINYYSGDVLCKESLSNVIKNVDVVIYLAAVIRTINKKRYKENCIGLKNTIEVMEQNGVGKLVYFSSINASIPLTGPYGDSKKKSEEIILNSNLDYIIVRPNHVYGIDKNNDFYNLYTIAKRFHFFPIIGNGQNIFEPINKKDLAELIVKIINNWKSRQLVYLSGKQKISLNDVAGIIKRSSKKRFILVHLPTYFLKPFKKILPLDIDGIDQDRVAKEKVFYGRSDLMRDLEKITKLD